MLLPTSKPPLTLLVKRHNKGFRIEIAALCFATFAMTRRLQLPISPFFLILATQNSSLHRPKKYNFPEALQKLRRYCAYQERCHADVRKRLYEWGFSGEDMDKMSVQLMEDGLLNEERYAKAIAGGKFRQKGWGRKKIVQALKGKGISAYLLKESLKEIDEADYEKKLKMLLEKKANLMKGETPLVKKQKLARFAIGKGYEPELVWGVIAKMGF